MRGQILRSAQNDGIAGPLGREAVGEYRTPRIEAREVRQRGRLLSSPLKATGFAGGRCADDASIKFVHRQSRWLLLSAARRELRPPYVFAASFARCPNSGMISRSMASRTAAVEPGIKKTAVPPTMPAQARLSIAAAPIS